MPRASSAPCAPAGPASASPPSAGPALQQAGAVLLFDLTAHAVVGLVEVLKNYGFFKSLFNQTVAWIETHQPRAVLFVDYPGFNLRLAEKLFQSGLSRKGGGKVSTLYYIGPQIWAWKAPSPLRHGQMARRPRGHLPFRIRVLCRHHLARGIRRTSVCRTGSTPAHSYAAGGPILLLPGSRVAPVSRIFPAMLAGLAAYREINPSATAITLYPTEKIRAVIESQLAAHPRLVPHVTLNPVSEGASGRMVLTSSGTMSLACALAGVPGAIVTAPTLSPTSSAAASSPSPTSASPTSSLAIPRGPSSSRAAPNPSPSPTASSLVEKPAAREQAAANATRLRQLLGENQAAHDAPLLGSKNFSSLRPARLQPNP